MTGSASDAGYLARYGATLIINGYNALPIAPGTKLPAMDDWQDVRATKELLDEWISGEHRRSGVGIATKNTPAVDIDVLDGEIVNRMVGFIREKFGEAPLRIGRAPKALLVFQCDRPFRKVMSALYYDPEHPERDPKKKGQRIEVLGEGQQFVAYAIHPDTRRPYEWPEDWLNPIDIPALDLPVITEEVAREICDEFERIAEEAGWEKLKDSNRTTRKASAAAPDPMAEVPPPPESEDEVARVKSALAALSTVSSEYDYHEWLAVIFAMKWTRWECAEKLTRKWSKTSDKHVEKTFNTVWRGAQKRDRDSEVTLGTLFAMAKKIGWVPPHKAKPKGDAGEAQAASYEDVDLRPATDFEPEEIKWLWPGWLAQGKLQLLVGPPGTGKTTIALSLAAITSSGGTWPDGTPASKKSVLIWSGEDGIEDTLIPRLIAAGADRSKIFIVGAVSDGLDSNPFNPAEHMKALTAAAARIDDLGLFIVDPIVSTMGSRDSHKNAEVRDALAPIVALAEQRGAAVIGISHFSKNTAGRDPLERVSGSVAFGAVARIVLAAARVTTEDDRVVLRFVRTKSNIGPDDGGFEYALVQGALSDRPEIEASRVSWGEALGGRARELLLDAADQKEGRGERRTKADDAADWLYELLTEKAMPATEIKALAEERGFSWRTVEKAKNWAQVVSKRVVKDGVPGWIWSIPAQQEDEL